MVKDAARDSWLNAHGIMVFRIPAGDLLADPDDTANGVIALALERMAELGTEKETPPTTLRVVPPPRKRGGPK